MGKINLKIRNIASLRKHDKKASMLFPQSVNVEGILKEVGKFLKKLYRCVNDNVNWPL